MLAKKVTALLVSAALALSLLLTGCGGKNQSLAQVILNLLDGQYTNVTVELDPDLDAALRQAVREAETEAEIRAALENILGPGISFQLLGDGQKGDTAWNLILYPGSDPDAAGRAGFVEWNKVFAALPDDGQYTAQVAMIETDNGYALLVQATVDRAGSEDKPEPVTLKSIAVTKDPKLEYWVGESFDPTGMEITATYSNGKKETIQDITSANNQGVTWTPDGALTTEGAHDITISYGGKTTTISVTVKEPTVQSIAVEPSSLTFEAGQSFTLRQITKVTATYTNGKIENVAPANCTFSIASQDITLPHQFTTAGKYTLTVSYQGKEDTIEITVNSPTLTSIKVTKAPDKTTYETGETFDPTGMVVTAYYSDGSSDPIASDNYTVKINGNPVSSNSPFATAGTYTLTVTYDGKTSDSVSIHVKDKDGYHEDNGNYVVTGSDGLQNLYNSLKQSGSFASAKITLNSPVTLGADWPVDITFSGTLNGNGNTITLTSNRTQGLFDVINGGTVENVNLQIAGSISSSDDVVGGIAGELTGGTVKGCSVTGGSISSSTYTYSAVGGVVGQVNRGTVTACYHTGSVSGTGGTGSTGGVVGQNNAGTVTACYHAGLVSGFIAGGVVGQNDADNVTACYWSGSADSDGDDYDDHGIGLNWIGESNNDNANQVVDDGKVDPDAGIVDWETALAGLNGQNTGYTFSGTMNKPILTKKP